VLLPPLDLLNTASITRRAEARIVLQTIQARMVQLREHEEISNKACRLPRARDARGEERAKHQVARGETYHRICWFGRKLLVDQCLICGHLQRQLQRAVEG
jgi:hypothetical protein